MWLPMKPVAPVIRIRALFAALFSVRVSVPIRMDPSLIPGADHKYRKFSFREHPWEKTYLKFMNPLTLRVRFSR